MNDFTPPRSAEFFGAALIADPELRDAVLGDLTEESARVASDHSAATARAWYWSQLVRSAIPFSRMAVARGGWVGWLRLALAVVVSYVLLVVLVVRTDSWLPHLVGSASRTGSWQYPVASLVAGLFCAMAAGFVASLIGGRSPFAAAFALGSLCVVLSALLMIASVTRSGVFAHLRDTRFWYEIGLMSIVLPGCIAGALLRARTRLRTQTARRVNS